MTNITISGTNPQFPPETWNQMLIEAARSRLAGEEPKNICRVIYPNHTNRLELKTDQEIKKHFEDHGSWSANCVKLPLREVLNITRICSLNAPVADLAMKETLQGTLTLLATRAERKYNVGCCGIARKLISMFFNFFATDSVGLFRTEEDTSINLRVVNPSNRSKLPWFIGNDADFARLINSTRFV